MPSTEQKYELHLWPPVMVAILVSCSQAHRHPFFSVLLSNQLGLFSSVNIEYFNHNAYSTVVQLWRFKRKAVVSSLFYWKPSVAPAEPPRHCRQRSLCLSDQCWTFWSTLNRPYSIIWIALLVGCGSILSSDPLKRRKAYEACRELYQIVRGVKLSAVPNFP